MKGVSSAIRRPASTTSWAALGAIGIARLTLTEAQGDGPQPVDALAEESLEYGESPPAFVP